MRLVKITAFAAAAAAVIQLDGAEWIKNFQQKSLPAVDFKVDYSGNRMEAVIPYLKSPDLKGGSKNWENAWHADRFTVTRKQAVNYAHALQGGGEWEQLLPKTLIPRKKTAVKMGYDKDNLYLQITCFQPQMDAILKIPSSGKRDGGVWKNENLDVQLTANRNSNEYFQLIHDNYGFCYDARQFRDKKENPFSWNPDFYRHVLQGKDRWVLTLALPVTRWGMPLEEGKFIDGNICRVEITNRENSTLSPVDVSFNEADKYCRFWLGKKNDLPEITAMAISNPLPGNNELCITVKNPGKAAFAGVLRTGAKTQKVALKGGESKVYKFARNFAAAGKYMYSVALLDSKKVITDQASAEVTVNPPLTVKLSGNEYISGGNPIAVQVTVNAVEANTGLEIVCGDKKFTAKALAENSFDLIPEADSGDVELKISLKKQGVITASVSEKISVSSDPFAE